MKQQAAGGFFRFQEATSEPTEKKGNLHHDIWCHITNTWANRVAIAICNHKIVNPCKSRLVNFCASVLFMYNCIQFYIAICCKFVIILSVVICFFVFVVNHSALLFQIWFVFCLFCSLLFHLFHSLLFYLFDIWSLSVTFVLILEMCSRYFDTLTTTIQQVKKHHTTRPVPAFVVV
jgi:hypothetical protein